MFHCKKFISDTLAISFPLKVQFEGDQFNNFKLEQRAKQNFEKQFLIKIIKLYYCSRANRVQRHTRKILIFKFSTIDTDSTSSLQPIRIHMKSKKHYRYTEYTQKCSTACSTDQHTYASMLAKYHSTHISFSEVPSLNHEIFDYTMEVAIFETISFFSYIEIIHFLFKMR